MTRSTSSRASKNVQNDTAEASGIIETDLGSFGIDAKQLAGMSRESQQVILCGFQCVIIKKNRECI